MHPPKPIDHDSWLNGRVSTIVEDILQGVRLLGVVTVQDIFKDDILDYLGNFNFDYHCQLGDGSQVHLFMYKLPEVGAVLREILASDYPTAQRVLLLALLQGRPVGTAGGDRHRDARAEEATK